MTAEDLARWNISVMDQSLLKSGSYRELTGETRLLNGAGTHYGLGIGVASENGRRLLKHGGEVSGFTAGSAIYPEDRVAVVVFTNQDAVGAYEKLTKRIVSLLFDVQDPDTPKKLVQAQVILADLQRGAFDRSLFTDNCNSYFDETARRDIQQSLVGLGKAKSFVQTRQSLRGGMTARRFLATFSKRKLTISTYEMPDGKLEQYLIAPEE
jgi:CubicO group peptidase (beta-lactamase class C family)